MKINVFKSTDKTQFKTMEDKIIPIVNAEVGLENGQNPTDFYPMLEFGTDYSGEEPSDEDVFDWIDSQKATFDNTEDVLYNDLYTVASAYWSDINYDVGSVYTDQDNFEGLLESAEAGDPFPGVS